jgi:hypothetical protein
MLEKKKFQKISVLIILACFNYFAVQAGLESVL